MGGTADRISVEGIHEWERTQEDGGKDGRKEEEKRPQGGMSGSRPDGQKEKKF